VMPRIKDFCYFCESPHVKVVEIKGRVMTVRVALCEEHKDAVIFKEDEK